MGCGCSKTTSAPEKSLKKPFSRDACQESVSQHKTQNTPIALPGQGALKYVVAQDTEFESSDELFLDGQQNGTPKVEQQTAQTIQPHEAGPTNEGLLGKSDNNEPSAHTLAVNSFLGLIVHRVVAQQPAVTPNVEQQTVQLYVGSSTASADGESGNIEPTAHMLAVNHILGLIVHRACVEAGRQLADVGCSDAAP